MKKQTLLVSMAAVCAISASAASWANSQSSGLYRWYESDGTITFSRQPPPEGSNIRFEKIERFSNKTPENNAPALEATPTVATKSIENGTLLPTVKTMQTGNATLTCDELKNRVLSLEKVVTTTQDDRLMDNAVVKMAGYHSSFRQACTGPGLKPR